MSVKLGAIGVQKVIAKLLEQGFLVSTPIYDDGYDLITDWRGFLTRVQVKCTSGSEDNRRSKLKFFATKGPGFGHMKKRAYSKVDCDTFIFYHTGIDAVFILPRERVPKTMSVYIAPNSKWRDNWEVLKGHRKA